MSRHAGWLGDFLCNVLSAPKLSRSARCATRTSAVACLSPWRLERALEQKKAAEAAVHARAARKQQQEYRPVEQKIAVVRPAAQAPDRNVGHSADTRKRGYEEFAIC